MKRLVFVVAVVLASLSLMGCASDDALKEQVNGQATKIAQLEAKHSQPTATPRPSSMPSTLDKLYVKELTVDTLVASKSVEVSSLDSGIFLAVMDDGALLGMRGPKGEFIHLGARSGESSVQVLTDVNADGRSDGNSVKLVADRLGQAGLWLTRLGQTDLVSIILSSDGLPAVNFHDQSGQSIGLFQVFQGGIGFLFDYPNSRKGLAVLSKGPQMSLLDDNGNVVWTTGNR